jgi:hypothetical protein
LIVATIREASHDGGRRPHDLCRSRPGRTLIIGVDDAITEDGASTAIGSFPRNRRSITSCDDSDVCRRHGRARWRPRRYLRVLRRPSRPRICLYPEFVDLAVGEASHKIMVCRRLIRIGGRPRGAAIRRDLHRVTAEKTNAI